MWFLPSVNSSLDKSRHFTLHCINIKFSANVPTLDTWFIKALVTLALVTTGNQFMTKKPTDWSPTSRRLVTNIWNWSVTILVARRFLMQELKSCDQKDHLDVDDHWGQVCNHFATTHCFLCGRRVWANTVWLRYMSGALCVPSNTTVASPP